MNNFMNSPQPRSRAGPKSWTDIERESRDENTEYQLIVRMTYDVNPGFSFRSFLESLRKAFVRKALAYKDLISKGIGAIKLRLNSRWFVKKYR